MLSGSAFIIILIWTSMNLMTFTLIIYLMSYQRKTELFSFLVTLMHPSTNESFDSLTVFPYTPTSNYTTRVRNHFKTLIDNIFSNEITLNTVLNHLTIKISDHLSRFLIVPNIFSNPISTKFIAFKKIGSSLVENNLFFTTYL